MYVHTEKNYCMYHDQYFVLLIGIFAKDIVGQRLLCWYRSVFFFFFSQLSSKNATFPEEK